MLTLQYTFLDILI